jgi:hypothetical protein
MANRPFHEMEDIRLRWMDLMHQWEFNEKSKVEQAKELNVSVVTVLKWHKDASPAFWKNVDSTIQSQHAQFAPKIYMSLVREAEKGSLGHQELFFKRMQGWSPINKNQDVKGAEFEGKSDAELEAEYKAKVLKEAGREELEKALEAKKAPGEVVVPTAEQLSEGGGYG